MTNEELNRRSAELLGWTTRYKDFQAVDQKLSYYDKNNNFVCLVRHWMPDIDPSQADMLVAEIGRLGLGVGEKYAENLDLIMHPRKIHPSISLTYSQVFQLMSATPSQKTAAFVATMEAR